MYDVTAVRFGMVVEECSTSTSKSSCQRVCKSLSSISGRGLDLGVDLQDLLRLPSTCSKHYVPMSRNDILTYTL